MRDPRLWASLTCGSSTKSANCASTRPPNGQPDFDRHVIAARTALGDDAAFDRAWTEGRAMPLEQAMELALQQKAE
jgi:hypothetical protein